jgi:pilus assembly protein CpaC
MLRAPSLALLLGGLLAASLGPAPASAQPTAPRLTAPVTVATPAAARPAVGGRQSLRFESGTGGVVNLPTPAANVFVADPKIAEVRPASATTLFVFGVGAGRTTVAAVDAQGNPIAEFDIFVRPPVYASSEAQAAIARVMPGSRLRVSPQNRGLLVSGQVASAEEAARALSIARGFVSDNQTVEDQIVVDSPMQVTLRVRIAEVKRTVTRGLGVNWQALGSIGNWSVDFLTRNTLGLASSALPSSLRVGPTGANALLDALALDNLARVLAEPNLTVTSGQSASFLAGGEYPIPVGQQNGTITIEFKKYGVNLTFLPTVLADGRINLKVSPEVSSLTEAGAVRLQVGNSSLSIPALLVRRAETMVELGSGQSFAIAGLLSDMVDQNDNALPFLGEVPVLGALFRSDSFKREQSELVILITPYLVRPVNDPNQLQVAGNNYVPPNDFERLVLLRQNGRGAPVPAAPSAAPQAPTLLNPAARAPGRSGFVLQ